MPLCEVENLYIRPTISLTQVEAQAEPKAREYSRVMYRLFPVLTSSPTSQYHAYWAEYQGLWPSVWHLVLRKRKIQQEAEEYEEHPNERPTATTMIHNSISLCDRPEIPLRGVVFGGGNSVPNEADRGTISHSRLVQPREWKKDTCRACAGVSAKIVGQRQFGQDHSKRGRWGVRLAHAKLKSMNACFHRHREGEDRPDAERDSSRHSYSPSLQEDQSRSRKSMFLPPSPLLL